MSLRDYFAAKALPALIPESGLISPNGFNPVSKRAAEQAYIIADEMLKAREK